MTPAATPSVFHPAPGLGLAAYDAGGPGLPVVFQHGLLGDAGQAVEVFPDDPRFRLITLECRGHGRSEAGDPAAFSMAAFADDLGAFVESRRLGPVVVGGISMGAALALRLAVKRPHLVRALILARPAWLFDPAPDNLRPYAEVGRLIGALPAGEAKAAFADSETARRLALEAPDNLASLLGFFDREPRSVTAALLEAIAADGPVVTPAEVRSLSVPALVIGHGRDSAHPFAYAETLARLIPGARLVAVIPKSEGRLRYVEDFRTALMGFLASYRSGAPARKPT